MSDARALPLFPTTPVLTAPPEFCEYADGQCDQRFDDIPGSDALFFYPSEPRIISNTIEQAIDLAVHDDPSLKLSRWRDLNIGGKIIFCEICKALRFTKTAFADVTTLNFNLLFEIGFAIGLGVPVVPIRDKTYIRDAREFAELGLLDTVGYLDFENARSLAEQTRRRVSNPSEFTLVRPPIDYGQSLFVVKPRTSTDGVVRLMSTLKKSGIRFRAYDPSEAVRISLHEAYKQVMSSLGVIVHLVAPERLGATVHNGRSAFIGGLAMAAGKHVLVLQESIVDEPIDYRDVVRSYNDPSSVPGLITPLIRDLYELLQPSRFIPISLPLKPLQKLDFGDLAAENEIGALKSYFLPTAQYNDVRYGHARLVVGRKGSGKTAIFYGTRDTYNPSHDQVVLDLKPEGHQFTKLRETVLKPLTLGLQEHVVTAFWHYVLVVELAKKVIDRDQKTVHYQRAGQAEELQSIVDLYDPEVCGEDLDFTERLLGLVDRLARVGVEINHANASGKIAEHLYRVNIGQLQTALKGYLRHKDGVWLLIDNLDKSWPLAGARSEDILIIRSLLEATRKLQRQLTEEFHAVVFIRNDIYEHLIRDVSDRGKDTAVLLDWNDIEVLKELIRRRIVASTRLNEDFDVLWRTFFDGHVDGEESFAYIVGRTQMKPRDLLRILKQCVSVAINRGHDKVLESDIKRAETAYSEEQLQEMSFELRDICVDFADAPYAFIGSPTTMTSSGAARRLEQANISDIDRVIDLLLWFGFFGVLSNTGEENYSYQYQYGVNRMLREAPKSPTFVLHPEFRKALGCSGTT